MVFSSLCCCHIYRNHFFRLYQQNKSFESKSKFRQLVIIAKGFLKLPNMHMLLQQKSPCVPRNLVLATIGELLIVFRTKVNHLYLLYSSSQRCCLLYLIKQNWEFYLHDSSISLPIFHCGTNLKQHNISITRKMVKKVITNLDSSKASSPDCIPVVVLKNCEPKLSYMPA